MKTYKCKQCGNATRQEDAICVVCRIGLTAMHAELVDLIKKDKKRKYQLLRHEA